MDTNGRLASNVVSVFCPFCFRTGRVTGLPKAGDLAVCKGCFETSVFSQTIRLRKPYLEELDGIAENPYVEAILSRLQ